MGDDFFLNEKKYSMKILNKIILLFLAVYGQHQKCPYSTGIKGHPKVTSSKNPAWTKQFKRRLSKQCKEICDKRKNCQVYAVNEAKKLCHTFTYKDLDQKKIIWEKDNTNMQWAS